MGWAHTLGMMIRIAFLMLMPASPVNAVAAVAVLDADGQWRYTRMEWH